MAKVVPTQRFVDDLARVYSRRVASRLRRSVAALENFLEIGSRSIPASIRNEFGGKVRKLVVDPFDLFYEYDAPNDTVILETLVHFRQAK